MPKNTQHTHTNAAKKLNCAVGAANSSGSPVFFQEWEDRKTADILRTAQFDKGLPNPGINI